MDPRSRQLAQQLEALAAAGVTHLPKAKPVETGGVVRHEAPSEQTQAPAEPRSATTTPTAAESVSPPGASLEILRQEVVGCTACDELSRTRTQTVFGVGDPAARLCFMGEAPGADEDRLGEPFVGRAGQLLNKIISACGMAREQVYILNTLKCRPPGNRNPAPEESSNCRGFLLRQLDLISPEYICCLGAVAAQNLLETTQSIGRMRGKVHQWRGINVVCTYHPAYLLRNPSAKRDTWDDMKMLMREMGTPVE
ncbi:MAG: uracil-DNA glycosylase [Planctomycetota bacterium]